MDYKQIDKLIVKLIENKIDENESNKLKEWLQNEDNLNYFNQFIEVNHLSNSLTAFSYKSSLKHMMKTVTTSKKTKKYFYKYGIAAAVIVLFGLVYVLNKNSFIEQPKVVIESNIEVGTDKAILTLEDGSQVALEKGQTYSNTTTSSNGEKLVYNASDTQITNIAYNSLTIPRGGQYSIKLSDGTQVWLNSESKLRYPVNFIDGQIREVELLYGEAYFDVSPSTKHQGAKFIVNTNTQRVEVLGTEFNIKAYSNEKTIYTTLVEGKVSVSSANGNRVLSPGEQAIVKDNNIDVVNADVNHEIAWRNGFFMFKKESLYSMLTTLSRWYDIEVVYENNKKKDEIFSGALKRDENVETLLFSLEKTGDVKFQIDNKKIIVK